jgi:rod shape determining protein RodA
VSLVVGRYRPARAPLVARALARRGLLRQFDWLLVVVAIGLTVMGTLLIWSATAPALQQAGLDPRTYLKKQILNACIGVALLFITASIDYRRYRSATPVIYALSLLLLLAVLTPAGTTVNGAKAWIALPGGFQVEPSEFAKLAIIVMTALVLSRRRGVGGSAVGRPGMGRVALAALTAAPLMALVATEPALGVTLVLVFVFAGMVAVSGLRWYWLAGLASAVAVAIWSVSGMHLMKGYQLARLTAFLHPQQDLTGAGYNLLQAKTAVGSGGMFGVGLFRGTFTGNNFVPSQQTDFIFTVAGEELGFVGCAIIICLLAVLIVRAIRVASVADDLFGMLVASGIAVWFTFQSFVNIGMTIGLMPITGLPLPFVSYGGSAIFADMIAIGLLQSVRRHHSVFLGG